MAALALHDLQDQRFDLMEQAERAAGSAPRHAWILPFRLYETLTVEHVVAAVPRGHWGMCANALLFHDDADEIVFYPMVCSASLSIAMYHAVCQVSPQVHALSIQTPEVVEIVGDILCDPASCDQRSWTVRAVVCENSRARHLSSEPSCGMRRRCIRETAEQADMRRRWCLLGEFHSHPLHSFHHIKPLSDNDVYQLVLACYLGDHGCSLVLAPEGVHWCVPRVHCVHRFADDVHRFFRDQKHTTDQMRHSLRSCRQPLPDLVDERLPLLYGLKQTERQYADLMRSTNPNSKDPHHHERLARRFGQHVLQPFDVEHHFLPWNRHQREWIPSQPQTDCCLPVNHQTFRRMWRGGGR